jgi:D-arabinose 1-dehydrogenase-like Zn-dependent alcohol dehydrogenase
VGSRGSQQHSPVTEVYPLEQVNEVHERLRQQKVRLRAVLKAELNSC